MSEKSAARSNFLDTEAFTSAKVAIMHSAFRSSFLVLAVTLLVAAIAAGQPALAQGAGASPGSHRGAQDKGLDLGVPDDFYEQRGGVVVDPVPEPEPEPLPDRTLPDKQAAKEQSNRYDMRQSLGGSWEMNPVLLNRRQQGEPEWADDDLKEPTLGVEIRRPHQ